MKNRKLIFIIIFMSFLLTWGGYKLYCQKITNLLFTGTIEVTTVDIMAKTNGYLKDLYFSEGDTIANNQLVAKLDRNDFTAQLERDTAALSKAKIQLADLEKGARPEELREASANVAANQSVYDKAHEDYLRYQVLFKENAITKQQLDDAKSTTEVAKNNLQAAIEKQNLLIAGNRSDVILAQRLEVDRCEAILKATQINAQDMLLYSPINGVVLTKNFERGEYVNVGNSIYTIADIFDCWVKIYIPSTQLGLIKIGQKAIVKIDSYPNRNFVGKVKEINSNAEFTPRQSITKNERANMVFAVKIGISNEEGILKPGMPADVIFDD